MYFLRVKVTFYDAVSMIHDVITTANVFPYTAKFMFDSVRNNKTQQMIRWKIIIEYVHELSYIKNIKLCLKKW